MPGVNVRFTEQQHAELVAASKANRRSLQKEIIGRLFSERPVRTSEQAAEIGRVLDMSREEV